METLFIATSPTEFKGVFIHSDEYAELMALPVDKQPIFFEHASQDVQTWLLRVDKSQAIAWVQRTAEDYRATVVSAATARKMAAWPVWKQIAKEILAGTVSAEDKTCFQIEVQQRGFGETVEQFATAVMADAIRFQNVNGLINGIERSTRAEIDAVTELNKTGPILMAARERAAAAFSSLMTP